VAQVRGLLCLITAIYFASSWSDAPFWYSDGGPLSPTRVSTFLQTGGLEDAARWIVSPLFLTGSAWIYRLYLVIGVAACAIVAAGRGGKAACWLLWLLLVGWANRAMILSGLTETLLSLGLFAAAIAPPAPSWQRTPSANDENDEFVDWRAGFSQRLMAVQITLIGLATFVTMLGGRVWFNGIGAYALAAPLEDRSIDWTTRAWFVNPMVHELLTHAMVIALPLGFALAWLHRTNRIGQSILIGWCIVVALLGSHWLYASAVATMVMAIRPVGRPLCA
jgi:hypothetical protein